MGKNTGLSYDQLLGLGEQHGGDTLEIGGQELARRSQDVDKAKERGLIESLDCPDNFFTVRTLVAVKENRDIGVRRH